MDTDESQPTAQYLKVITLLDFTPGYAETPETGQKIGILHTAHNGEVEQAMMLSLADVKRMVSLGTMVLAHHGDSEIEAHLMEHCPPRSARTGQTAKEAASDPQPRSSPLETTGVTITVGFGNASAKSLTLHVLGGYHPLGASGGPAMLICRTYDFGNTHEFIAKIEKKMILLRGHPSGEILPKAEWLAFSQREPGYRFHIDKDGPLWRKMPISEVKRKVAKKVFTSTSYGG